jgi:class 3 adenylate cyclase
LQHELGVVRKATDLHAWAERYVREMSPSRAGDAQVVSTHEALSALAGTPEAWYWDQLMFSGVDLRDLLPSIHVPTLVLSRPDAAGWSEPRSARVVAERIPNARLVELPGDDALPWIGESEPVLAEIREFVTGSRETPPADRRLATVLFTDVVGSTEKMASVGDRAWHELLAAHHERIRAELSVHRGREIDTAGDGFFATFEGPAHAVACAQSIIESVQALGMEVRVGIHTGEIDLTGASPGGIAVHIGARIAAIAGPSEALVSQTVKDLVTGSGLMFEDAGEHELKGVPDRWRLYRVVDG